MLLAIDKIAFSIGGVDVAWYGIIIVIGMIAGLAIVCLECKRINLELDDAVELFLVGHPARGHLLPRLSTWGRVPDVYFPIESWDDFVDVIAIWDGGITIIGGLVGGLIGAGIFAFRKRKKCNFGNIVDLIVVPVLTGQIIGRLGNFVNQEAFGIPITDPRYQTFPFAVWIDRPQGVEPEFRPIVDANTPGLVRRHLLLRDGVELSSARSSSSRYGARTSASPASSASATSSGISWAGRGWRRCASTRCPSRRWRASSSRLVALVLGAGVRAHVS